MVVPHSRSRSRDRLFACRDSVIPIWSRGCNLVGVLHVVLFQPRIPQNTGNIGRLCAVVGCRLHLIHPLGFRITDAKLRRAGLDYWFSLDVHHHPDWEAFLRSGSGPAEDRLWLVETGVERTIWQARFEDGDGLVFGSETEGSPPWLMERFPAERSVMLPHGRGELRSLNLSTAAGVAVYEAWRQIRGGDSTGGG